MKSILIILLGFILLSSCKKEFSSENGNPSQLFSRDGYDYTWMLASDSTRLIDSSGVNVPGTYNVAYFKLSNVIIWGTSAIEYVSHPQINMKSLFDSSANISHIDSIVIISIPQ